MNQFQYRPNVRVFVLGLLLILLCAFALPSPGGITGRTLKSTPNGCGSCHGSTSSSAVVVAISGPTALTTGQTAQYTVTVNHVSGTTGGINIAASTGTLAVVSANLRLASGELTHTGRQTVPSTYTFNYTAPTTAGTVTLYATGKGEGMNFWNWAPNLAITVTAAGAAPTVTTAAASAITTAGATLNGSVNPNGLATTYYFQYGTTTTYGSQTASTSAGSGTAAVNVNAAITGLTAGTLYHFRLVATNSAGTTNGADLTFTTSAPQNPPTVTTSAATAITTAGATLNGSVNPNGLATTYYFQYGTTTTYGSQTASTSAGSGSAAVNVNAAVTGLTAGTLYHFRLVATSSAGSTNGADLTFTTTTAQSPPTVTTSAASSVGQTGATLNGSVNPNGQATTYYFQYGTTTSYGSQTASTSAGSGSADVPVNAAVSGLTAGTLYHFRLVATNGAGTTNGADMTFTTTTAQSPPTVTTSAASSVSQTGATLNGSVNPNGQATTYYFQYGTTTGYGSQIASTSAGSGSADVSVNAAVSGLTAGTLYHFRLVATNGAGTTNGADLTFTTGGAQGPPAALTEAATSISSTGAILHGTVNPNGLATTYYFQFGTTATYGTNTPTSNAGSGSGDVMASTNVNGLTPNTLYHFRLAATNSAGTTYGSDLTFTTTSAANAPVVVTGAAGSITDTGARLNGTVDPNGLSAMYYFEYGFTTTYGSATGLRLAGAGTTAVAVSASLSGLTPGTLYHYRLVATNDAGTTAGDDLTFTTTDANGVAGDLDGNGAVNVVDLVLLSNILAGNIDVADSTNLRPLNGDLDQSGTLDATDYVLLSQILSSD